MKFKAGQTVSFLLNESEKKGIITKVNDDETLNIELLKLNGDLNKYERTGNVETVKQDLELKEENLVVIRSLAHEFELYKKGLADAPKVYSEVKVMVNEENGPVKCILTKEISDRDGEIVDIAGIAIEDMKKGVPLLDSHYMGMSVVQYLLGRVINLKKRTDKEDGYKVLEGELSFAPTPNGRIAETLVRGGFVDSVSIGFGVKDYDFNSRRILKSELYETSLVSVPANPAAKIDNQKSLEDQEKEVEELEKTINHYKEIKPKVKEYRRLFMSSEIFELLKIEKKEDEYINMKNLYDAIIALTTPKVEVVENQQPAEIKETPKTVTVTQKELEVMILKALNKLNSNF